MWLPWRKWLSLLLKVGVSAAFLKSDLWDLWVPLLSLQLQFPHDWVSLRHHTLKMPASFVFLSLNVEDSNLLNHDKAAWTLNTSSNLLLLILHVFTCNIVIVFNAFSATDSNSSQQATRIQFTHNFVWRKEVIYLFRMTLMLCQYQRSCNPSREIR